MYRIYPGTMMHVQNHHNGNKSYNDMIYYRICSTIVYIEYLYNDILITFLFFSGVDDIESKTSEYCHLGRG